MVLGGPPAPDLVSATAGHLENRLEWCAVSGASRYVVYRAGPGEKAFRKAAVTSSTHYVDPVPETALGVYRYRVAAASGVLVGDRGPVVRNDDIWITKLASASSPTEIIAANGEVLLRVPARALASATRLTIEERVAGSTGCSSTAFMTPALDFGPDGTVFRKPVELEIAYRVNGGELFEENWLARTARLHLRNETGSRWDRLGVDVTLDTERDVAMAQLDHFSTYAVGYTSMPHGRYTEGSRSCKACHSSHDAMASPALARARFDECFYCHGNASASSPPAGAHGSNVQAEFIACDDQAPDVFDDSWHPFVEETLDCGSCHEVHNDPSVNPKLLFNWQSDGSKTYPTAAAGGAKNPFCFGCHGSFRNAYISDSLYYSKSGGDHQTIYTGPHADLAWTPSATVDATCQITPSSGSGIQCLVCHQRHGAKGADYLNAYALGAGAQDAELCYRCHGSSGDANTWNGRFIEREFARASSHDISGTTGAALYCASCHNSHTVTTGTAEWSLGRMSDPDNTVNTPASVGQFCLRCHDGSPPSKTLNTTTVVPYTVIFPSVTATFFPGWDKSPMTTGGHYAVSGAGDTSVGCDNCHDPHGSDNARLTAFSGGHFPPVSRQNSAISREERLCFGCHGSRSSWTSCDTGCHAYMPDIQTVTNQVPGTQPDWYSRRVGGDTDITYSVAVSDIDNDGDLDIVSGSRTGEVYVYKNSASGSVWTTVTAFTSTLQITSVAIGDIDNDGDRDIVLGVSGSGASVLWLDNTAGDGSAWSSNVVITSGSGVSAHSVAVSDFDRDGDLDIVSGRNDGNILVHSNAGNGAAWNHTLVHSAGGAIRSLAVGAIDGDIDIDIASVGDDQRVRWHSNPAIGGGGWSTVTVAYPQISLWSVAIGDINGSGDNDIVVGGGWKGTSPQGYPIYWYDNTAGDGSTWTTQTVGWGPGQNNSAAVADIDDDGDLDVIYASGSQVSWNENASGDGLVWAGHAISSPGGTVYGVRAADIDADGYTDVVSGSGTWGSVGHTHVHENRVFDLKTGVHPIGTYSNRHSDVETAGAFGVGNRHVECVDCHEVHTTRRGNHVPGESTAGAVFWGSTGVRPSSWPAAWTTPTGYVAEKFDGQSTDYEAYVCFKCHSGYTTLPTTGGSGGYGATDAAREFNPNNASYHAVVGTSKASSAGGYLNGWTPTSRMTCSDCHTTNLTGGAPKGPHGSAYPFILKGSWSATVTPDNYTTSLCGMCHDLSTTGFAKPGGADPNLHFSTTGAGGLRHRYTPCVYCHSQIPHGFNRAHMVVYSTEATPYSQASATYGITSYAHPASGNYSKASCGTASTECH